MSWYAATPQRAARQVAADVFVIAWIAVWWWASRTLHDVIDAVAEPARSTATAAHDLAGSMSDAGSSAGGIPLVGEELRRPLDSAAGTFQNLEGTAGRWASSIEHVADVTGWVVLLIPVAIALALWLPIRIRFFTTARATRRFIDAAPDLDLFALRAMATQPMTVLARISDDPAGAWRRRDRAVVTRLAEVELRRIGLLLPDRLKDDGGTVPSPSA